MTGSASSSASGSGSGTLVCFDLGRVLVRLCDGWAHAFTLAALDGALTELGPATQAAVAAEVHAFEIGAISVDEFAARTARLLGCAPDHVARMVDVWITGLQPGVLPLLDALRARGHTLACLSNTNARHWALMQGWDDQVGRLFARFHHTYGSHDLRLRKPDPEIYGAVERASGFAPSAIVFFDDLADNVAAARARGWRANLVRSLEDPVPELRALLTAEGLL